MSFRNITSISLLLVIASLSVACVSTAPENRYYYDDDYRYDQPKRELSSVRDVINRVTLDAFDVLYPMEISEEIPLRTISYGMNRVEPALFSYASGSAKVDPAGEKEDLWLDSKPDSVQFAVYHFRDLNYGEIISKVEITGSPRFGQTRINGIYVGLRQGFDQRYTWHGPYDYYSDWEFELSPPSVTCIGGGNPSMVIAVANGDDLKLSNIWVEVLDVDELKHNHVYRVGDSRWPVYPTKPVKYRCNNRIYTTGYYNGPCDYDCDLDDYYYWLNVQEQREYELKLERLRIKELKRQLELKLSEPQEPIPNPFVNSDPPVVTDPVVAPDPPSAQPVLKSVPVL